MAEVVAAQPPRVASSYVDWGAIIAGAVIAAAVSFVLLTAGAAIGLSLVSPYPSQSFGGYAAAVGVFWTVSASILAFLVGGYTAGRLRAGWERPDESEFRDGIHGALVWGASILIGGLLSFLVAATAAQIGTGVSVRTANDPAAIIAPTVDSLLRGAADTRSAAAEPSAVKTGAAAPAPASPPSANAAQSTSMDTRAEATRTLTTAVASGELTPADRRYLAQIVAQRTGLSQADAERQVDVAYAEARRDVEKARKASVLAALVTATALLFGLAAAWYAAQNGGRHRDQNIPAKFTFARRPVAQRAPGVGRPSES